MSDKRDLDEFAFADREDAGRRLGERLSQTLTGEGVVVLGIPRGGVEVAAVVAEALHAPLDVVIPRKLGAPRNPELGLGAVAGDVVVLDARLIETLGVSQGYLRREIEDQRREIERREALYRGGRGSLELSGRTAVVVDDGVATGGTAAAALRWARQRGAAKVILAVPVAPPDAVRRLADDCDRVVALATPTRFYAVGQWYLDFAQVSDDRVVELLASRGGHGTEG
jgi:putative phosphoribosyl transferase